MAVVVWKGLTGSSLSLMQTVRKIRLPVSVVVNGSHHSPTLTVDRKSRHRGWPQPHKCPLQTIAATRVQPASVVTERVKVHQLASHERKLKSSVIRLTTRLHCYLNNIYVSFWLDQACQSLNHSNQKQTCCASSHITRSSSTFCSH